ncbi:unnamed protein product, partial [Discosporangium mesarthrocarpum]
ASDEFIYTGDEAQAQTLDVDDADIVDDGVFASDQFTYTGDEGPGGYAATTPSPNTVIAVPMPVETVPAPNPVAPVMPSVTAPPAMAPTDTPNASLAPPLEVEGEDISAAGMPGSGGGLA